MIILIFWNKKYIKILGKGNKERIVYYGEYAEAESVTSDWIVRHMDK